MLQEAVDRLQAIRMLFPDVFMPGVTVDDIADFETSFGAKLPDELREFYHWSNGGLIGSIAIFSIVPPCFDGPGMSVAVRTLDARERLGLNVDKCFIISAENRWPIGVRPDEKVFLWNYDGFGDRESVIYDSFSEFILGCSMSSERIDEYRRGVREI
jgi:hypothetical protein